MTTSTYDDFDLELLSHQKRKQLSLYLDEIKRREENKITLNQFIRDGWDTVECGAEYVHGWHIDAICEHLTAVTNGQIKRLLINVPPGTMKSLLTCVFWPAWEWGSEDLGINRYISTCHKEALALRDNNKMRRLVCSDWYNSKYPQIKITKDQNAKGKFENTMLGFREACASDSLTGSRGDRLIIDDPLSVDDARSKRILETREEWFCETVPTRLISPKKSAIIIIMQRLDDRDTSGIALSKNLGYEHVMLPMEFEKSRRCTTSIGFSDPRKEDGELLFPERFPQSVVDDYKKSLGTYGTAGQLQQRPAPRGGGIIKSEWWCYFVPTYDAQHRITSPAFNYTLQSWDTAFKEGQDNDYSACTTWGVNNTGAYLISAFKAKMDFPALLIKVKELYDIYRPSKILVEDKASGQSLLQSLKKHSNLPIKPVKVSIDKENRLHAVSTFIESGRVFLMQDTNWVESYKTELETFPRAAHDDMVDSTTQALAEIFLKSRSSFDSNVSIMGR